MAEVRSLHISQLSGVAQLAEAHRLACLQSRNLSAQEKEGIQLRRSESARRRLIEAHCNIGTGAELQEKLAKRRAKVEGVWHGHKENMTQGTLDENIALLNLEPKEDSDLSRAPLQAVTNIQDSKSSPDPTPCAIKNCWPRVPLQAASSEQTSQPEGPGRAATGEVKQRDTPVVFQPQYVELADKIFNIYEDASGSAGAAVVGDGALQRSRKPQELTGLQTHDTVHCPMHVALTPRIEQDRPEPLNYAALDYEAIFRTLQDSAEAAEHHRCHSLQQARELRRLEKENETLREQCQVVSSKIVEVPSGATGSLQRNVPQRQLPSPDRTEHGTRGTPGESVLGRSFESPPLANRSLESGLSTASMVTLLAGSPSFAPTSFAPTATVECQTSPQAIPLKLSHDFSHCTVPCWEDLTERVVSLDGIFQCHMSEASPSKMQAEPCSANIGKQQHHDVEESHKASQEEEERRDSEREIAAGILEKLQESRCVVDRWGTNLQELKVDCAAFSSGVQQTWQELREARAECEAFLERTCP